MARSRLRRETLRAGWLIAMGLVTVGVVATGAVEATTPPATTVPATTPPAPPPTSTSAPPPPDRLAGVNWLQATYPSPCGGEPVALVAGTALVGGQIVVLEDVRPLDPTGGSALAVLSCLHSAGTSGTTLALVGVGSDGSLSTTASHSFGGDARVVVVDASTIEIESPEGTPPDGSCCAPLVRTQRVTIDADALTVVDLGQRSAFERSVVGSSAPTGSADLVRSSVPAAGLCYRWSDSFWPQDPDPDASTEPLTAPSAELQTMRLALIYLTGQWFDPAPVATPEMAAVAEAYQASKGLVADGVVGSQTAAAIATDLGCPAMGGFRQIDPPALGPRRFATVNDLTAAARRYVESGSSGNPSLDALLYASAWDGRNSMFLGCSRRQSPAAGVTCSWSGATPLQLVGLVDDPAVVDLGGSFSVLYARSAAPSG